MSGLEAIAAEQHRQEIRWGRPNHPDGTGPLVQPLHGVAVNLDLRSGAELARAFQRKCANNTPATDNWRDILLEEVFEALAEQDPIRLRRELAQVGAVTASWIDAIERREFDA